MPTKCVAVVPYVMCMPITVSQMTDRFLYWSNHQNQKSGEIKDPAPLSRDLLNQEYKKGSVSHFYCRYMTVKHTVP